MCVAIIKPKGSKRPTKETLKRCWTANPDGGGFAVISDNKILIKKGFMDFDSYWQEVKKIPKNKYAVLHMRIATSGGITPQNTHPFPISDNPQDLKQLTLISDTLVVHNGVVGDGHKDLSDTMVFIKDCIAPNQSKLADKGIINLLSYAIGTSKFLIIDLKQNVFLQLGNWIEYKGLIFSNLNWEFTTNKKYDIPDYETWICPNCYTENDILVDDTCSVCGQAYIQNEFYW